MSTLQGLLSALAGRDLHWRGQSALVLSNLTMVMIMMIVCVTM